MKYSNKFLGVTMTLVAGGVLMSCTNELTEPIAGNGAPNAINLVKAPEIYAYAGSLNGTNVLGIPQVYTNAGNGNLGNQTWADFGAYELQNIEDEEREGVLAEIAKKVTGSKISEEIVFYYENYFLQDVVSGVNGDFKGAGSNGTSSASYTMEAFSKGEQCDYNPYDSSLWNKHGYYINGTWDSSTNAPFINSGYTNENYTVVTNSGHISNMYVHENPDKSQTQIKETALMTDMHLGTYEEMKGKQFRWFINCHEYLHWSDYIVVKYKGNYYICFDFGCGHEENKYTDGHPGRDCETNDWDYNDWVLKITLAGNGQILGEDNTSDPQPENPEIPGTPSDNNVANVPDHVEVNLSLEERLSYLTSHLSIHVRAVTDVEVFIPIPAEYVCETDDLEIVQKHKEDLMVHGGPATLDFEVNGEKVTLTVDIDAEGIKVTTAGINENVISYLKEQNNDGITFEIWNYFNIKHSEWVDLTHEYLELGDIKNMMNKSTIKFLKKAPDLYVNAFMYETGDAEYHEGHEGIFCDDFSVKPYDPTLYDTQETNWFYNNSPYNELYYNKPTEE